MNYHLKIIGGGLAGSEAAWQAAQRGIKVTLYEMRPVRTTGAHQSGQIWQSWFVPIHSARCKRIEAADYSSMN